MKGEISIYWLCFKGYSNNSWYIDKRIKKNMIMNMCTKKADTCFGKEAFHIDRIKCS